MQSQFSPSDYYYTPTSGDNMAKISTLNTDTSTQPANPHVYNNNMNSNPSLFQPTSLSNSSYIPGSQCYNPPTKKTTIKRKTTTKTSKDGRTIKVTKTKETVTTETTSTGIDPLYLSAYLANMQITQNHMHTLPAYEDQDSGFVTDTQPQAAYAGQDSSVPENFQPNPSTGTTEMWENYNGTANFDVSGIYDQPNLAKDMAQWANPNNMMYDDNSGIYYQLNMNAVDTTGIWANHNSLDTTNKDDSDSDIYSHQPQPQTVNRIPLLTSPVMFSDGTSYDADSRYDNMTRTPNSEVTLSSPTAQTLADAIVPEADLEEEVCIFDKYTLPPAFLSKYSSLAHFAGY